MRTFSSTPHSFQFPDVKSVCPDIHWRQVKFSPFAVLSRCPCPLIKFCSARNYFFYCCSLCPHKWKNKCCALEKLWSEIPWIWTYTRYDLTAFCQSTVIIEPGRNSAQACVSPRAAACRTGPSRSKTPTVNVGGILLSRNSPWNTHCCIETLILGGWRIL